VTAAELAALPDVVRSVSKASSTKEGKVALLALRRLSLAGLRDSSDDTMVDACIGIEALLSENSTDLTYKIAVRGAAVIGARPERAFGPQEAFTMLKHVYARRSELVHGTLNEKKKFFRVGDQEIRTSTLAVLLLRELLFSQLTGDPAWTINDLDEKLLTSLIQDTPAQPAGPGGDSTPGTTDEGK
jgi:Apea-like HEPN